VAVLFGGPSAEHDISIRSADSLIGWLSAAGEAVEAVHWRRDRRIARRSIAPGRAGETEATALVDAAPPPTPFPAAIGQLAASIDAAFPIVHGTFGEDGTLQGLFAALSIPCVGCGVRASALAMDKQLTKAVLMSSTTLRLPRGERIAPSEAQDDRKMKAACDRLKLPWIVKPVDGGSSFGLGRVTSREELPEAVRRALAVGGATGALVEEQIAGDEVTCAVVGDAATGITAFPPILIRPRHGGMFDLESKYTPGATDELCPAPLPANTLRRIEGAAVEAYRAFGCQGFARVDFMLADGVPWFLELNTLPGLTRESLFPKAARAAGRDLPGLFAGMVRAAIGSGSRAWATAP
jgi:D-alanine--D-alanine ligase